MLHEGIVVLTLPVSNLLAELKIVTSCCFKTWANVQCGNPQWYSVAKCTVHAGCVILRGGAVNRR